jgi:signal transduction histidine kinase/DNA-binding LacI/PurR family transcriptional regulator/CheY-like chemotaxis protein
MAPRDYAPEMPVAHSPSDGRARRPLIGMLIRGLREQYEKQWLGAVDSARANGCDLITFIGGELQPPDGVSAAANAAYDLVSADRLDGLLVCTPSLEIFVGHERMVEYCEKFTSMPIVSLERSLGSAPFVGMSDRDGMRQAVEHLIVVHGHDRIGFVRGPAHHAGSQDRLRGYLDALSEHGIAPEPALISEPTRSWEAAEAYASTSALLATGARPSALAAANDDYAIGVLSALEDHGVRSPDEVAVVGYDDSINVRANDVAYGFHSTADTALGRRPVKVSAGTLDLTTVRAPMREMAWQAIENVVALIRGDEVPQQMIVPATLVIRRSCGCLPIAAPHDAGPELMRINLADSILSAMNAHWSHLPVGWNVRLAAAFTAAMTGVETDVLEQLDECVRLHLREDHTVDEWRRVVDVLHREAVAGADDGFRGRLAALHSEMQTVLHAAADRSAWYRQTLEEKRDQIVREVGQRLITASDVDHLAATMAEELPKVGISRCYVAGHVDPGDAALTCARLLFGLEDGQAITVPDDSAVFASRDLVPADRLRTAEPASYVMAPLNFAAHQLGFALFGVGPRTGWIYEAVQEQIASALQSATMIDRERRALAAVEEARAELERRVAERTAELADANADLTRQIAERHRAEQMQRALEGQLRQAQKMEAIGRLAGGVAHDFNNLLVVINGNSEGMLKRIASDHELRDEIDDIRHAGERAANLTRQLLAFSRQQVLHPRQLDLNRVISDVRNMLGRMIGEDIKLRTELAESLPLVWADEGQLEQIIFNVAVNARDAMPDGGELTMATAAVELSAEESARPGDYVCLRITDTGIGMEEEVQARLFEPFFTTKPQGKGTGLGLATVFGIVQQSGGQIQVRSAPHQGTTFEIYLRHASQQEDEVQEVAVSPDSVRGTETVLLVEDDPDVRTAARRFLASHGYDVLVAVDGVDALRIIEEYKDRLDLVITDVVMPNMGGRELASTLRESRPELPVLFVSGYASSSARQSLSDEDVQLLEKPFTAQTLVARVRELLDAVG